MELIKIYQGNLVDARELHKFLESKRQFANWIAERIKRYGFEEGKDYLTNLLNNTGLKGKPKKEYALTLNMAKELAMVENNDKGRQARRYFIEAEQALIQLRQNKRLESFMKLEASKNKLSSNIQSIGGIHQDYIQIDTAGRKVLFNGEPMPDETLPEILLKGRDFAVGLTNEGFKSGFTKLEDVSKAHQENHNEVRDAIIKGTGKLPEEIPPESDIKKLNG